MQAETFKVGDVVVTSGTRRQLVSRLLMWAMGSTWTHVFIVGPGDTLLESAFPHGVAISSVADRLQELAREGRVYRVLRLDGLTDEQATTITTAAAGMRGRKYDVLQAVLYGLCRHFIKDGPLRLICSRYVTAAYAATGIDLFPVETLDRRAGHDEDRYAELRKGWCTPEDFIDFSVLIEAGPSLHFLAA